MSYATQVEDNYLTFHPLYVLCYTSRRQLSNVLPDYKNLIDLSDLTSSGIYLSLISSGTDLGLISSGTDHNLKSIILMLMALN